MGRKHTIIIGAGPAGLATALELLKSEGLDVSILENERVVGGRMRTIDFQGRKCDNVHPGFYVKDSRVAAWFHDMIDNEFVEATKQHRIYWKRQFFTVSPLLGDFFRGLGVLSSFFSLISYLRVVLFPIRKPRTLKDRAINMLGRRLYALFLKSHIEKTRGVKADTLPASMADYYLGGFSFRRAVRYTVSRRWGIVQMLALPKATYLYPKQGVGALWNRVATQVCARRGGAIRLGQRVVSVEHDGKRIFSVSTTSKELHASQSEGVARKISSYRADEFLSSMSRKSLILALDPLPEPTVVAAAKALRYQELISVHVLLDRPLHFTDQWLTIYDPTVAINRIAHLNVLAPGMVEEGGALTLEYRVCPKDKLSGERDEKIVARALQELSFLGIIQEKDVLDALVTRMPEAYLISDEQNRKNLHQVEAYLSRFENLILLRNEATGEQSVLDELVLGAWKSAAEVLARTPLEKPLPLPPQQSTIQLAGVGCAKKLS